MMGKGEDRRDGWRAGHFLPLQKWWIDVGLGIFVEGRQLIVPAVMLFILNIKFNLKGCNPQAALVTSSSKGHPHHLGNPIDRPVRFAVGKSGASQTPRWR